MLRLIIFFAAWLVSKYPVLRRRVCLAEHRVSIACEKLANHYDVHQDLRHKLLHHARQEFSHYVKIKKILLNLEADINPKILKYLDKKSQYPKSQESHFLFSKNYGGKLFFRNGNFESLPLLKKTIIMAFLEASAERFYQYLSRLDPLPLWGELQIEESTHSEYLSVYGLKMAGQFKFTMIWLECYLLSIPAGMILLFHLWRTAHGRSS